MPSQKIINLFTYGGIYASETLFLASVNFFLSRNVVLVNQKGEILKSSDDLWMQKII